MKLKNGFVLFKNRTDSMAIYRRIDRVARENFGDHKFAGGNKSIQQTDIKQTDIKLAKEKKKQI